MLQGGEDPIVKPNLTEDWVTKMQKAGSSIDYVKVHGDHGVAIGQLQMFAQHEKDQHTPSSMVAKALDWICQQAADPKSPYYNKIDVDKIAAAGHSCGGAQVLANAGDQRLKTYIILNAGMGKMTMADASKKSLKNLHAPILYLVGGT